MKTILKVVTLILCATISINGFAQKKETVKKVIFTESPAKIEISKSTLQSTLQLGAGQFVAIRIDNKNTFYGKVVANDKKYDNLQSMIIKSRGNDNTFFQLSAIINEDKNITYTGRIINADASDMYQIKKDNSNNYYLEKIELNKVYQDCLTNKL
jgi:hypothetical protein